MQVRITAALAVTIVGLAIPVAASGQGTSYDDCRESTAPSVVPGPEPGRAVVCVPAGEHSTHVGGDEEPCGDIVAGGYFVAGEPYRDPATECWGEATRGAGVAGRLYQPAVRSKRGVVAARSPLAAQAGIQVLDKGGNAIDAAAAATFAAGVVRPDQCGIGGGGFLVYRSAEGELATLDFAERTPAATDEKHYDPFGRDELSAGYRMVSVPGVVAGMDAAIEKLGKLTLADAIAPAERLAREGFEVSTALAWTYATPQGGLAYDWSNGGAPTGFSPYHNTLRLAQDEEAARVYLGDGGLPPKAGSWLELPDHAETLRTIAAEGADAFYRGTIAKKILAGVLQSRQSPLGGDHGIMTAEDLANYKPVWRDPLVGTYRDAQIVTMRPSSAGGTFLVEALNILEGFDLNALGHSSALHLHLLAETQELAWADKEKYVDPETDYPIEQLTSKDWAAERRKALYDADGNLKPAMGAAQAGELEEENTLHLSVLDAKGNAAAVTCSLGSHFGADVVPPGTGFLLNDSFPDNSGKYNKPNPNRRVPSNKTPVIVVREGLPILVTGGAGASSIPVGVLNAVSNAVDFRLDPARALDAARVDAIRTGTQLWIEGARVPEEALAALREMGHTIASANDRGADAEYGLAPVLSAVGMDPTTDEKLASDDPREERGPAAQAPKKPTRGG